MYLVFFAAVSADRVLVFRLCFVFSGQLTAGSLEIAAVGLFAGCSEPIEEAQFLGA